MEGSWTQLGANPDPFQKLSAPLKKPKPNKNPPAWGETSAQAHTASLLAAAGGIGHPPPPPSPGQGCVYIGAMHEVLYVLVIDSPLLP